jgi:hypothetical protein
VRLVIFLLDPSINKEKEISKLYEFNEPTRNFKDLKEAIEKFLSQVAPEYKYPDCAHIGMPGPVINNNV